MKLSAEHVEILKSRIFDLAFKFANEHGLNPVVVELDLGFICAHYAGSVGVLDDKYREWLDAYRQDPSTDFGGATRGG